MSRALGTIGVDLQGAKVDAAGGPAANHIVSQLVVSQVFKWPLARAGSQVGRSLMRRLPLPTIAVLVLVASSIATAQKKYPIFTPAHLENAMKMLGLAFGLVTASLAKDDFENSKDFLSRSREQLAPTVTFWKDREKDDAIKLLTDTVRTMDDLDAALSAETIDQTAVKTLAKQVNAACEACHAVYREQDPATKAYRLKPDSVPE